jgi:uncharacterized protein
VIWIDGDACPRQIKEIIYKTSERKQLDVMVVANSYQKLPKYNKIKLKIVSQGLDKADEHIIEKIKPQEIVITSDIPFAAEAIAKGAFVITPTGDELTKENINERLSLRNFFDELRSSGQHSSKNPEFNPQQKRKFANAFDRIITMVLKN